MVSSVETKRKGDETTWDETARGRNDHKRPQNSSGFALRSDAGRMKSGE